MECINCGELSEFIGVTDKGYYKYYCRKCYTIFTEQKNVDKKE